MFLYYVQQCSSDLWHQEPGPLKIQERAVCVTGTRVSGTTTELVARFSYSRRIEVQKGGEGITWKNKSRNRRNTYSAGVRKVLKIFQSSVARTSRVVGCRVCWRGKKGWADEIKRHLRKNWPSRKWENATPSAYLYIDWLIEKKKVTEKCARGG